MVYVRAEWGDAWTWIPFMRARRVTEAVAPAVSSAELEWRFGRIKRNWLTTWKTFEAVALTGGYVLVAGQSVFGEEPLWAGVIEADQIDLRPAYTEATTLGGLFSGLPQPPGQPQGDQTIEAVGLEHILDRRPITGAATDVGWIDRGIDFNERRGFGYRPFGNRSTAVGPDGVHVFSADGQRWTALQALAYLLQYHGLPELPITIDGQWGALDYIVDEWRFDGLTLWQAINTLIDRRRGLGWRIVVGLDDIVRLWVFSHSPEPIVVEIPDSPPVVIPANQFQSVVDFTHTRDTEARLNFSEAERYDAIDVRGGPVSVCCTLSNADANLVPAWSAAQEAGYIAAPGSTDAERDVERATDKFAAVYQRFRVPDAWNWLAADGSGGGTPQIASPAVAADGWIHPDVQANAWTWGKTFDRQIPLLKDAEGEPELRSPFAIASVGGSYQYLDRLDQHGANVSVSDSDLAVYVEPRPINHIAGDTHFTGDSEHDPEWNWETMRVTVMLPTDQHLRVRLGLPPETARRVKRIVIPEAVAWYILHGTVVDVAEGTPQRWGIEVTPVPDYVVRNDVNLLRAAAVLAAVWYAPVRRTIQYTHEAISLAHFTGSMIRAAVQGLAGAEVNTVVTQRTWDFDAQTTNVQTGYAEIDAGAAVE